MSDVIVFSLRHQSTLVSLSRFSW